MSQSITCPNCWTQIDLDKLAEQKYADKLLLQEKELKAEQEKQKQIFEEQMKQKEDDMRKKALEFADKKALEERKKIELEMQDMQDRLKKSEEDITKAKQKELEFLQKQRDLEDKEKNFELEIEKKILEQRKKIEEDIVQNLKEKSDIELEQKMYKVQEEFRKKELETQKREEQMKKTIDDLKRKAEQWSQQIQWDIQEDDLRNTLSLAFPIDEIKDVPTWVKWADLIQIVKNNFGQNTWIIVWESKNTKNFENSWIMKLKEDKLKINWNIAILVSSTLPKDIKNFAIVDDIMICSPEFAISVCSILRDKLISISKIEKSLVWKDIKMEMLYKYLTSEEFSGKINMMADVFSSLKSGIDSERRAMEKNWKKREKDLERATFAITGMYGELESLMWQALPWTDKLSLWYNDIEDDE